MALWLRSVVGILFGGFRKILRNLLAVPRAPTVCPGNPAPLDAHLVARMPRFALSRRHPSRRFSKRARVSLGALVGASLFLPAALGAAEPPRHRFDIPAGDALVTLKQFAAQSNTQLLYTPDDVSGVQTQAVHGSFVPLVALEHLLERTPLRARQDAKTRAFSVVSRPAATSPPTGERIAPPTKTPPSESTPSSSMNSRSTSLPKWLAVLFSAAAVAPLPGQSTTPTEPKAVALSPFEVTAEQDHGYQALSTLAGGRIQTNLKDTPATISILTKEFMEDLALDSNVEFAAWAPNSEIPYTANGFLDEYRTSSRALSPSFGSRNYFRSYTSGDIYNTERLEYARGPNALLFGDASIGGITTVWTKQARLQQRIATLQSRFDTYGSYRANVDYNFSPNQKFAVRANALFAHTGNWRDLEESETKAIHLASTVALTKKTQFRIEGEYSDKGLQVPFGPILDQVSSYLSLTPAQQAASIWSGTKTTAFPTGTTRNSTDRNVWIQSKPELGVLNWLNRGRTTGSGLSLVPEGRGTIAGFPVLPSREFNPNAPSADIIYKTVTASAYLDQRVGDNLFLQVAYNYSRPETERDEVRMSDVFIDVNEFLPSAGTPAVNGQKNPYYAAPFSEEETRLLKTYNILHEMRAMAAWKFENSWTTQAFSALISQRADKFSSRRFRQVPRGIKTGATYFNANSTADLVYHRRYWNDLDSGDYGLATTFTNTLGQQLPIEWRNYEDTGNESTLTSFQLANVGKFFKGRLSFVGGYRYDKYDRIESTLISRYGSDSPDNGLPREVIMDPAKRLVSGAHSPSVGGVYWLTEGFGLSANYAESFNLPVTGASDIYNRPIGPSNAKGIETGFRFDLWDSKLTGSLLYYKNESSGGGVSTGLDAANVFNRINAIWVAIDPTQSVSVSRDVQSTSGHGYEAEVVYNPTKAWRMRFAAGVPYAETTDKWIYLKGYIAENRARWTAGGALPTTRTGTETTVKGTLDALDLYFLNNAEDGLRNTGGYKWNANYFTSYRFMSGALKGLSVGGGARYTGERFIGRTSTVDAAGVNQYAAWWVDGILVFNGMAKYDFKLMKRSVSVQLNVENLLNNRDVDYRSITTVSGTTYFQNYVWIPPIKFVATANIRF